MNALLASFLACLILEMGDGGQKLTLALAQRYGFSMWLVAGMAVAAFGVAGLAGTASLFVAPLLGAGARNLFLAICLLISGAGLIFRQSAPDTLENWRIGVSATAAIGLFILTFGNGAQFLAFGIGVRVPDPVMITIGAGLGTLTAWMPAALWPQAFFDAVPITWVRRGAAAVFLCMGSILALSAVALI